MRYSEIAGGLRVPVNGEEQIILDTVGTGIYSQADFDERSAEVARLMVSKGLLHRLEREGELYVCANTANDVWRF